jgi:hypothetical protein
MSVSSLISRIEATIDNGATESDIEMLRQDLQHIVWSFGGRNIGSLPVTAATLYMLLLWMRNEGIY